MTGPLGNSEFCFPPISNYEVKGNIETGGKKINCFHCDQSLSGNCYISLLKNVFRSIRGECVTGYSIYRVAHQWQMGHLDGPLVCSHKRTPHSWQVCHTKYTNNTLSSNITAFYPVYAIFFWQRFSLGKAFIIQEKGFIIEIFNFLCL